MHEHFRQDNRLLRVQFGCCLSAVLELNKHDYPENSRVVFCPNKQRCFEPFMCLDLQHGLAMSASCPVKVTSIVVIYSLGASIVL